MYLIKYMSKLYLMTMMLIFCQIDILRCNVTRAWPGQRGMCGFVRCSPHHEKLHTQSRTYSQGWKDWNGHHNAGEERGWLCLRMMVSVSFFSLPLCLQLLHIRLGELVHLLAALSMIIFSETCITLFKHYNRIIFNRSITSRKCSKMLERKRWGKSKYQNPSWENSWKSTGVHLSFCSQHWRRRSDSVSRTAAYVVVFCVLHLWWLTCIFCK